MPDFADDWIAFPHPVGLIDLLRIEFEKRYLPVPCFMGTVPGAELAIDYIGDECGAMSYARTGSVYPALNFPEQDTTVQKVINLASTIELGTFRSIPLHDDGEPLTPEEQFEVTRLQMADMNAMLHVLCAYADSVDLPILIGTYSPYGPDGMAVGGSWTATIAAR